MDSEQGAGTGLSRETVFEIEKAMGQIMGVISVRVVADELGAIQEVHALTGPERSAKQVVRDLESLLFAKYGIRIDHKKISIAQIGDEPVPAGPASRLAIKGVELRNQSLRTEVRVELSAGEETGLGVVEGPSSQQNRLRLVVQATLAAVQSLLDDSSRFVLEEVGLEKVARREVVVVCVSLLGSKGEENLLGTCQVGPDETEATIRATLSALNRRLGRATVKSA